MYSRTLLPKAPYVYNGLLHFTDWLPTILSAANVVTSLSDIDGIDQWQPITQNLTSNRDRFVYELWEEEGGLRIGNYKLVYHTLSGPCSGWYNPLPGVTTSLRRRRGMSRGKCCSTWNADPYETTDLSKGPAVRRAAEPPARLRNREWARRLPPQISAINPNMPGPGEDWDTRVVCMSLTLHLNGGDRDQRFSMSVPSTN
ncbi:arylsulfatase I-like [Pomacea canaliculata]|uniref:arylsulfatase I-like n=1 Tax=Pomacea canaliculata TaxID=400727 RepID=UPI000D730EA4|nr:arylsulfatase I-like [Pomacea canaliculata]